MMNTVLFQFDFSNPLHSQLFGQLCANGIPFQMVGTNSGIGGLAPDNDNIANNTVSDVKVTKEYKDVPKHIDNMGYEVKKLTNSTDGKDYYCIGYVAPQKFHMCRDLKSKVNAGIKALDKITTITVKYIGKDDTEKQYKAWGYATKATAEKKIPTLATSFDYIEKEQIK